MFKRILSLIVCLSIALPWGNAAVAASEPTEESTGVDGVVCPSVNLFGDIMFTKVCWSCMLPISWGGTALLSGEVDAPEGANDDYTCYCSGDTAVSDFGTAGIALGIWQPTRVLEVVKKPYCYPALFGADLSGSASTEEKLRFGGGQKTKEFGIESDHASYYEVHMYAYPLLNILQMLDIPSCTVDFHASFDLLFMSEAFPHWSDDTMAVLINPEALLFANPVAQMAQIPDCTAATLTGNARDELFWTMGCWGSTYPLTGSTHERPSLVNNASLASARFLFLLGRMGFVASTLGEEAMCKKQYMPILKKRQFRMQQVFPVPESGDPKEALTEITKDSSTKDGKKIEDLDLSLLPEKCCHSIGASTYTWGEHRVRPGTGENFLYVVWQWVDCCVGIVGI